MLAIQQFDLFDTKSDRSGSQLVSKEMQTTTVHGTRKSPVQQKAEGGLFLEGMRKESQPGKPLITIITATFNVAHCLPSTIDSIRQQTCRNIEWIVVDGASRDGTIDLLKKNEDIIDYWVSEPDSGIYDAWNKGVKLAHGDFICFLGADDCWAAPNSLEKLVSLCAGGEDVISAKAAVVSTQGVVIRIFGEPWSKKAMEKRQVVAHPGMLFDATLFRVYGLFDSGYAIAGDYEWLLRLGSETRSGFLDEVTVLMGAGGVSEKNLLAVLRESRNAQARHVTSTWIERELSFLTYLSRIFASKIFRFLFSRTR